MPVVQKSGQKLYHIPQVIIHIQYSFYAVHHIHLKLEAGQLLKVTKPVSEFNGLQHSPSLKAKKKEDEKKYVKKVFFL